VNSKICYMFTSSQRSDTKNNQEMKPSQEIANQIKSQITDLKANNQSYDLAELIYDYTAQSSVTGYEGVKLREELFEILG